MQINPRSSRLKWYYSTPAVLKIMWIVLSLILFFIFFYFETLVTEKVFKLVLGNMPFLLISIIYVMFVINFILTIFIIYDIAGCSKRALVTSSLFLTMLVIILSTIYVVECGTANIRDQWVVKMKTWISNPNNLNTTLGKDFYKKVMGGSHVTEAERNSRIYEFISDRTDDVGNLVMGGLLLWLIIHSIICYLICSNEFDYVAEATSVLKDTTLQTPIINDEI